jgi:ABC-type multidrug transport system fused ATPase/permease subunit
LSAIEKIRDLEPSPLSDSQLHATYPGFNPLIEVSELGFTYPGAKHPVITNISLTVNPGDIMALVGPSGSGKTTLVDLILGLIRPNSGSVKISSESPEHAIKGFPGAISYVPQEVEIFPTTLRRNLAMGFDERKIPDSCFWAALEAAQLDEFVLALPNGLDTHLSMSGINLSGGQKQRLGIARALFTNPRVLVLDESTSALDSNTESQIVKTIQALAGDITVIIIAHRLSSIKDLEMIYYIGNGQVLGKGNFQKLKDLVPEFAYQANLMSL